jgi:hypothetical protein
LKGINPLQTTFIERKKRKPSHLHTTFTPTNPQLVTMTTVFSNPNDKSPVNTRHQDFIAAFNAGTDIDHIMSFFSPNVSYSDYAIEAVNMNYATLRSYMEKMFAEVDHLHLTQVSITGDKNFTAAEWIAKFKYKDNAKGLRTAGVVKDLKVGEQIEMRGVSLSWYDAEGNIIKNSDYSDLWSGGNTHVHV